MKIPTTYKSICFLVSLLATLTSISCTPVVNLANGIEGKWQGGQGYDRTILDVLPGGQLSHQRGNQVTKGSWVYEKPQQIRLSSTSGAGFQFNGSLKMRGDNLADFHCNNHIISMVRVVILEVKPKVVKPKTVKPSEPAQPLKKKRYINRLDW